MSDDKGKGGPGSGRAGRGAGPLPKWYAVQVETGREDAACALVLRAAEADVFARIKIDTSLGGIPTFR